MSVLDVLRPGNRLDGDAWNEWKKTLPTQFLKKDQPKIMHDFIWENKERAKDLAEKEALDAKGWDRIALSPEEIKAINDLIGEDFKALPRNDISEVALKRVAFIFQTHTYYYTVISSNMLRVKIWDDIPEEDGGGTFAAEVDLKILPHEIRLANTYKTHADTIDFLRQYDGDSGIRNFETLGLIFLSMNYFMLHYGEIAFNVKEIVCKKRSKKRDISTKDENRKVHLIKSYTLKRGWKNKVERKKTEIHCLAWGVRGHYRHYKDGRVIYIAPFVKGKERDKYKGKEYALLPKSITKDEGRTKNTV